MIACGENIIDDKETISSMVDHTSVKLASSLSFRIRIIFSYCRKVLNIKLSIMFIESSLKRAFSAGVARRIRFDNTWTGLNDENSDNTGMDSRD